MKRRILRRAGAYRSGPFSNSKKVRHVETRQLTVFPDKVFLRRVDPEKKLRRFYLMTVQRDLFGNGVLITEEGRLGQPGRLQTALFEDEAKAVDALATIGSKKLKRGYEPDD